jgi:hypothetical protein
MLEAVQALNSTTTVDALPPLLAIARSLPPAEFQSIVQPTLVRLFSSPERNLRASLLQHMSSIVEHLEPSILIENIYPQVSLAAWHEIAIEIDVLDENTGLDC